jgi:hypothetical protein
LRTEIKEIIEGFMKTNPDDRRLSHYWEMRQHPGWEVHQEILMMIRGKIAEEVLSERFTRLDIGEKDARQRAYNMVNQLIKFLVNPMEIAQKRALFKLAFDQKMGINPVTGRNLNERSTKHGR